MSSKSEKELIDKINRLEKMLKVCEESLKEYKALLLTISKHFEK